jgi:hypothetical protein
MKLAMMATMQLKVLLLAYFAALSHQFFHSHLHQHSQRSSRLPKNTLSMSNQNNLKPVEYINGITGFFGNFLPKTEEVTSEISFLDTIAWNKDKIRRIPLTAMAMRLQWLLEEREWFVTGKVEPSYFDEDFKFQDPDVKVDGIEAYARGVNRLFDQEKSRGEIVSAVVNTDKPNTITVTWRLSGAVKVGPGIDIKPFVVYTDYTISEETGLINFQLDRFSIPGYDIVLSALFPFTRQFLSPEAPPIEELREKSKQSKKMLTKK